MIYALVGKPGVGKTITMVEMMRRRKKRGRRCVSNFNTRYGLSEFMLWHEMLEQTNCDIFIDEAHMWFSSDDHKANKRNKQDLAAFQMHRKDGLNIYWCSQNMMRVEKVIRELTMGYYQCGRIGRMVSVTYRFEEQLNTRNHSGRFFYMMSDWHYSAYYSEQCIGMKTGEGYRMGLSDSLRKKGDESVLYVCERAGWCSQKRLSDPDFSEWAGKMRAMGLSPEVFVYDKYAGYVPFLEFARVAGAASGARTPATDLEYLVGELLSKPETPVIVNTGVQTPEARLGLLSRILGR